MQQFEKQSILMFEGCLPGLILSRLFLLSFQMFWQQILSLDCLPKFCFLHALSLERISREDAIHLKISIYLFMYFNFIFLININLACHFFILWSITDQRNSHVCQRCMLNLTSMVKLELRVYISYFLLFLIDDR